jgi:hypothetical protein
LKQVSQDDESEEEEEEEMAPPPRRPSLRKNFIARMSRMIICGA